MKYGWRPFSVVSQPARIAMNPSGHAQPAERKYQRDVKRLPRSHSTAPVNPSAIRKTPMPTMMRKAKKTIVTRGWAFGAKLGKRGHAAIPIVREDEAAQMRNGDCRAIDLGMLIGQREEHEVHGPGVAPMRFDRGNLCRLVLKRVQAVLIAEQKLNGPKHGEHADAHAHHGARLLLERVHEEIARTDASTTSEVVR